jgi:hypothetical protein
MVLILWKAFVSLFVVGFMTSVLGPIWYDTEGERFLREVLRCTFILGVIDLILFLIAWIWSW